MRDKDIVVLRKVLGHIDKIERYCAGCTSADEFQSNTMRAEAAIFNLLQIGEIVHTSLSDEAKSMLASTPWKLIYRMRNRLVHGYDDVKMEIVWETIANDLPQMAAELKIFIEDMKTNVERRPA